MRRGRPLIRLAKIALVWCVCWGADVHAQEPTEVILFRGQNFEAPSESFVLADDMVQAIVSLPGRSVDRFGSIRTGDQVHVTAFAEDCNNLHQLVSGGTQGDAYGMKMWTGSEIEGRYRCIVINLLTHRFHPDDTRLPFGVRLHHHESFATTYDIDTYEFTPLRPKGERSCVPALSSADDLLIQSGAFPASAVGVTLWSGPDCTGEQLPLPDQTEAVAYNLWDWGFGDRAQSLSLTWNGPSMSLSERRAAPSAPDRPPGDVTSPGDEIARFRLVGQTSQLLQFEVQYHVDSAHGTTVFAGARLHGADRTFGGYSPVRIPTLGDGRVTIDLDVRGETTASRDVEFFLFEPGQDPFLSRRFPFVHGQPSPPQTAPSGQPDYRGCFRDAQARDLSGFHLEDPQMTTNMCLSTCKARGFSIAATQFGTHCFCGDSFGRYSAATTCDVPCGGDASETCGGSWANSVYQVR